MSHAPATAPRLDPAALAAAERYFGVHADDLPIADVIDTVELAGGDWLFRQDDPGDAMYLLVRGRLRVWRDLPDEAGEEDPLLGEVAQGECVGEAGLLTGQGRSAGVRAVRDSLLVRVDRASFARLAERNPALVLRLAGVVADRMRQNLKPVASGQRPPRTLALLPLDGSAATRAFVPALLAALAAGDRVVVLARDRLEAAEPGRRALHEHEPVDAILRHAISTLETTVDRVVFVCDGHDTPWTRFCLRQADRVLRIADAGGDAAPRGFELAFERELLQVAGSRHALVLLQPAGGPIRDTLRWLVPRRLDLHLHVRAERLADDVARVARVVSGRAIGLVFGAGAARGFAHLGVNQALRELGVPVDWLGGSSIGAIIAAAVAEDWSPEHTTRTGHEAFVAGKPFSDYTLPLVSLLAGRRMRRLLRKHLPGNIEDLPLPFFCLSSNLSTGQSNVHLRGPLWEALSASAALPGVLPPTVHEGHLAIDGSVLNSLPVDVMQAMPVARVIAVDLASRKDYRIDYTRVPSAWQLLGARLRGKAARIRLPNLATLMLKSTEIGTVARVREMSARADLLLAPPVGRFGLLDVGRFTQLVKAGYDEAMARVPDWFASQPEGLAGAAARIASSPTPHADAAPAREADTTP
jgi:predicted acylesterase/phospholipase RssA/CRP-like cAMP-binding protein